MSDVAIRVSNLGKQYKIGARRQRADTLRDALAGTVKRFVGQFGAGGRPGETNTIWALKDVSFEVKRGEVLGVIGRNGAGKSTLLKILSRITEPTTGEVDLHGRVGSLLEVGTGFHAELSGRENIYLNGAIIGMKRREIQRRFDEIVDFAGVEQFIDTPVKHYSSGMYVRLAFAVAAYMETEILLIDEVLAVGDAEFQRKCLDRLETDARLRQVTTLVVSHNIGTIRQLCAKALLLHKGELVMFGPAGDVCDEYLRLVNRGVVSRVSAQRLEKSEEATIFDCWCAVNGQRTTQLSVPDRLEVHAVVDIHLPCLLSLEAALHDQSGHPIGFAQYGLARNDPLPLEPGRFELCLKFPSIQLANGHYTLNLSIGKPNLLFYDLILSALELEVHSNPDQVTQWTFAQTKGQGSVLFECDFSVVPLSAT